MPDKTLLYVTQVIPEPTGSGLAMRAYQVLKALSLSHTVFLLVIGRSIWKQSIPAALSMCREIQYVPVGLPDRELATRLLLYKFRPEAFVKRFSQPVEWGFISRQRILKISRAYEERQFDVLHAFRLYTTPFAEPFFSRSGFQQLDLDDIDSETRSSISRIYSDNSESTKALRNQQEAKLYETLERNILPKWKRVFVCSDPDKGKLQRMYGHSDVQVLPNIVSAPPSVPAKDPANVFRFLFVGSFYYYPNEDAILYFCERVLPIIRDAIRCAVYVTGAGMSRELRRRLIRIPEVKIAGFVPDLTKMYRQADAVIAPIRAGGGTRMKILEAFSYQTPVITTSTGIYGIEAKDEEHCLIADTPEQFGEQCIRISNHPELRSTLSAKALSLVQTSYSTHSISFD